MDEILQVLDLAGEVKHALSAEVIDVEGLVERRIKIHACCAIDHDIDIVNQHLVIRLLHAEVRLQEVAFDGDDLAGYVTIKLISKMLLGPIKTLGSDDFLFESTN